MLAALAESSISRGRRLGGARDAGRDKLDDGVRAAPGQLVRYPVEGDRNDPLMIQDAQARLGYLP